jgi:acetoin utilization protein AcuB
MLVRNQMTKNPITVNPETSLASARDLIKKEKLDIIPVVNKKGHLLGVITEQDVLYASPSKATTLDVFEIHTLFAKMKVEDIMEGSPLFVSPDMHVEDAAMLIQENDVSGVCVVEKDILVGIITESDLLRVFMEIFSTRRSGIRATAVCPQERGELAKLSSALYAKGADILAFASTRGDDMTKELVVIKADGIGITDMEETIAPFVLEIKEIVEV